MNTLFVGNDSEELDDVGGSVGGDYAGEIFRGC